MAGLISLGPEANWSSSGWLFYWVLQIVADAVEDSELTAELNLIIDENLGYLDLCDLSGPQRQEVEKVLRSVGLSDATSPPASDLVDRTVTLAHLRELARLVDSSGD